AETHRRLPRYGMKKDVAIRLLGHGSDSEAQGRDSIVAPGTKPFALQRFFAFLQTRHDVPGIRSPFRAESRAWASDQMSSLHRVVIVALAARRQH
ncbi:MAG: hypothetical protein ACRDWA_14015, partial [Acidimicrobiia bacterium]